MVVTSPQIFKASSTLAFRGVFLPPRGAWSAVTISFASQAVILAASASGEKPPKTIE